MTFLYFKELVLIEVDACSSSVAWAIPATKKAEVKKRFFVFNRYDSVEAKYFDVFKNLE